MFCKILEENLLHTARTLKVGHGWVFQHDSEPKHIAKATKKWLEKIHIKLMEQPVSVLFKNCWREMKLRVAKWQQRKDLKSFCKKVRAEISCELCANL